MSVNPAAVAAASEPGIDTSADYPKPWTGELVSAADVDTMGCGDPCPLFLGKRYEDWDVADPDDLDMPTIRGGLGRRVVTLIDQLHLQEAAA